MRGGAGMGLILLAALVAACTVEPTGTDPEFESPSSPGEGVLFIGNSLTGRNDLPGMVAALSRAAGVPILTTALIASGSSLEDQWGASAPAIARGGWDAVVMQQGPSTLPESREHLIRWAATYSNAARAAGADPYLYMVWPPLDGNWERGIESYRKAALAADAGLFPVAEAFQAAWRRDPELRLLAADDFHPSPLGSYMAAIVMVAHLQGRTPVGLPHALPGIISVDERVAQTLQQAAEEAISAERP